MICFHVMKFEIQNVARVREASISLDGVTVIVGMNGSGKSSIARGVAALRYLMAEMTTLLLREQAWSLIRHFVEICPDAQNTLEFAMKSPWGIAFRIVDAGRDCVKEPERLISASFWDDPQLVYDYFAQYRRPRKAGPVDSQLLIDFSNLYKTCSSSMVEFLNEQSETTYIRTITERILQRRFHGQLRPLCKTKEKSILQFADDKLSARVEILPNGRCKVVNPPGGRVSGTHYLETRHMLDPISVLFDPASDPSVAGPTSLAMDPAARTWVRYLTRKREQDPTPEEAVAERNRKNRLAQISKLIHGQLQYGEANLYFHDDEIQDDVRASNIASGMKSMAIIAKAVENGWILPGDLLVIDEPESNLHPEWQVEFARWLVALSNELDIRLLLNTHSPYFMRATELSCRDSQKRDRLRVYRMEPEINDDGTHTAFFNANDVTYDIASVYSDMARPFDELTRW